MRTSVPTRDRAGGAPGGRAGRRWPRRSAAPPPGASTPGGTGWSWLLLVLDDRSDRRHPVGIRSEPHDPNALGRPPSPPDLVHPGPDDLPAVGDEKHVVLILYHHGTRKETARLGELRGLDPLNAASLALVLLQRCALAEARVGDDQEVGVPANDLHGQHLVVADAGFGKRTPLEQYQRKGRGIQGVKTAELTEARGFLAGAMVVQDEDDVFLITDSGQ